MADRGDTHYALPHLNLWFLVSSIVLLGVTVWMVLDDYHRPWKDYQREFRAIEVEQARAEIEELEEEGALAREGDLRQGVEQAEQALAARKSELDEARQELRRASADAWRLNEDAKKAKAEYDWERYLVEIERAQLVKELQRSGAPAAEIEAAQELEAEHLAQMLETLNQTAFAREQAELERDAAQRRVDALLASVDEARKALVAGTRELDRVRTRLEALAPTEAPAVIASKIRDDIPGLDFIGPTIKVQKVLPPDLTFELNFTKKQRIDMCHTCHMGIDREGFEDQPHPYRTHPRLDLYLTANSPHPLKQVGCTICHRGAGEALDFYRADHRPHSDEQAEQWEELYHWHKKKYWDYPMLSRDYVEASCVQCHTDSMELIAEEAPRVAQGYQLFERYGCYSCHKVEWFPTQRRPGPALTNFQAKFGPEFLSAWIADPRGFRPSTWMPQIFHLENFEPDEEIVPASAWGEGRPILGQEWNDTAVEAVASFLLSTAPPQPLPPVPVEGDAYRGREVMRLSGCFGCHNVAPWDGEEPRTLDPTLRERGANEHGPNLRGVATKVTPEWLFHWLKDPAAYWHETRMPDLRLSDQEAADIVAYMTEDPDGIFTDTPEGWVAERGTSDVEVLREQARWLYSRDGRATVEARFEGQDPEHPWDDVGALEIAVGEKLVAHYGCFSCHEIRGMEAMMPIGTELTNWGSKTVDKLDFALSYQKELDGLPILDHHYREGWLERKLHRPRSYDLEKVKNPIEKLRMGWFDLSEEEVKALSTFVVGLVDDEVQHARMVPTPAQHAMDAGLRAVRQKNCMACHQFEPGTVTYRDDGGSIRTVMAELVPFEEEALPRRADEVMAFLDEYAEEYEIEEVGFRLLRPEPDVGPVGSRVFVPVEDFLEITPPRGGDLVDVVTAYYLRGGIEFHDEEAGEDEDPYYYVTADPDEEGAIQDVDGEFRVYYEEPYDKVRWTFAPPVLWNEGHKVRPEWFYGFLNDVQPIRPQIRVRMPSFTYGEGEAAAIVDYLAHLSVREYPAHFARTLRLERGASLEELARAAGISADNLRGIEEGQRAAIDAAFPKLLAHARETGFAMHPPVDPSYEHSGRRSPAYLEAREAALGADPRELGSRLGIGAVNCFQCHFRGGQPPPDQPIAWAPDLVPVHERLREDWVHEWLIDPQAFYPGTSMPANFSADPPQYQDAYPGSTNAEQLQVVLDWLFNLDRPPAGAQN